MHEIITQAIQLLNNAISEPHSLEKGKTAYKKLVEVCTQLQQIALFPEKELLAHVDKLTQLDAQLCQLKTKYNLKIHEELQSIRDRKVYWASLSALTPHCTQMYFADEDKSNDKPLLLPLASLDLLKAHSFFCQVNWAQFLEKGEIQLHSIQRQHFIWILEHLAKNVCPEIPDEEIGEVCHSANFLGLDRLHEMYLVKVREAYTRDSWKNLFEVLCEFCVGKLRDDKLAQAIFTAYLEIKHRYAINSKYFKQPDIAAYVEIFCQKQNMTVEHFWDLANTHLPSLARHLLLEEIGQTPASEEQAPTGDLHHLPEQWLKKQVEDLAVAGTPAEFEKILQDITAFTAEHEDECTEYLVGQCSALTFVCLLYLGRYDEARALMDKFDMQDLPQSQHTSYFAFLSEQGRYLTGLPATTETRLCSALWNMDKTALEQVKNENDSNYWFVHGVLYESLLSFDRGLTLDPKHTGCCAKLMERASIVPFEDLRQLDPQKLTRYASQYAMLPEVLKEKSNHIQDYFAWYHLICTDRLKCDWKHNGWMSFYALANGHPVDIVNQAEEAKPFWPERLREQLPVTLAHRRGDYDQVIALANRKNQDEALLTADAYRRKGDFVSSQSLLEGIHDPAAAVILKAIQQQLEPDRYDLKYSQKLLEAYPYHRFIELSYLTAAKNEANHPEGSELLESLIDKLETFTPSLETLRFLQSQDHLDEYDLIAYKKWGYCLGAYEKQLHDQLSAERRFDLMDAGYLADAAEHHALYGEFLFLNNQFEKAVEVSEGSARWVGECYEHLGDIEKACKYYEQPGCESAVIMRAKLLRKRMAGEDVWEENPMGVGDYPEACQLFKSGHYGKLLMRLDQRLTWKKVEAKGLHVRFLVAQSYLCIGNIEEAKRAIKEIMNYAAQASSIYPNGFFEEVLAWKRLHLDEPHKKQKR